MAEWKRRPLSRRRFLQSAALGAAGLAGAALADSHKTKDFKSEVRA